MKRLLVFLLCIPTISKPTIVATGNSSTANVTFTKAVTTSAYHTPTQTWFLGLANGAGAYSLSKISTTSATDLVPSFSAIGTGVNTTGKYINHLTISTASNGPTVPYLAFTCEADDSSATTFKMVDKEGTKYATTGTLQLADNATDCVKIHALQADNNGHVFAVVSGADTSAWAAANDAIAPVTVNYADPITFTLNAPLDVDTTAFSVTVLGGAPTITNATAIAYTPDMGGRLYIGASVLTTATESDSSFGVATFSVDTDGTLTNLNLTNDNEACTEEILSTSPLAVENEGGETQSVTITKLAVMKTSTGFYYLVSCGGPEANGDQGNSRNKVYALPLVSGNATAAINGTLASNDLTTDDFSVQCATQEDMGLINDDDVLVGSGDLPIDADDANKFVSELIVQGDTVYCALQSDTVDDDNAPGIYFSQAIFNDKGKIARWTDWEKAAPFSLGDSATDGSTSHSTVDATTGELWGIDTHGIVVKKTTWTKTGSGANSLITLLNNTFPNGCYSVYDLNQSIDNFGAETTPRYAYFGGPSGKVLFTKISDCAAAGYLAPQTVVSDFTAVTAFYETDITTENAPVTALGYSKGEALGTNGYFLAGTKNGLYAWALTATGAGFDPANYAALNVAPFTGDYSWQKITAVTGHVKKIKSTKNQIYILTRDTDPDNTTYTDKVFRITVDTTLAGLNTNTITLATSGTGAGTASDLSTATFFFDIQPMMANDAATNDKLLLATNDGIFQSAAAVEDDANQTAATWTRVNDPVTDNFSFSLLTSPYYVREISHVHHVKHTTCQSCTWGKIGSNDTTTTANTQADHVVSDGTLSTTLPTKAFWSDGNRRFYIGIPGNSDGLSNKIYTLPFRIGSSDWNLAKAPGAREHAILKTQDRFYWVQQIGATGALFVGGNNKVISLE